ncbi:DNA-directed RNA polymerase subunit K [Candidatus Pacearchaeota archaeon]|nr:DNA-directed RNA polymerase subunit K [Candidatus Pacearchaeota archaeon]
MVAEQEFSKYERARIIGARGLQISMDAPLLTEMSEEELNGVNFDPLKIAEKELNDGVLPISVNRPMPEKKEEDLEKIKVEETKISDNQKEKEEKEEEKDIAQGGEMMELAESGEEPEVEENSVTNKELE